MGVLCVFLTAMIFGENQLLVCCLVGMGCKHACGGFFLEIFKCFGNKSFENTLY